jgi:hypothetical protein
MNDELTGSMNQQRDPGLPPVTLRDDGVARL